MELTFNVINDWNKLREGFNLKFNDGWNDYGYYTSFNLIYMNNKDRIDFGQLKIAAIDSDEFKRTYHIMPELFHQLSPRFFSVGNSKEYYEKIKNFMDSEILEGDGIHILELLNDVSYNNDLYDKNKDLKVFKDSLLLNIYPKDILNTFRNIIFNNNNELD